MHDYDSHPPAHCVRLPPSKGDFYLFPTQRVGELNHFRLILIEKYLRIRVSALKFIPSLQDKFMLDRIKKY